MKILLAEIPEDGLSVDVTDPSWLPARQVKTTENAQAHLFLQKKGRERVFLQGQLIVDVHCTCDRCLDEYIYPIDSHFTVDFELIGKEEKDSFLLDHHCSASEMDVYYLDKPAIEIYDLLCQQLFIELPEKQLCGEQCKGLCPHCGKNLNTTVCACVKGSKQNPFTVLAQLKKC